MANASSAFDQNRGVKLRSIAPLPARRDDEDLPWLKVRNGELPPMMFQLRFRDGRMVSFAYSDIREIQSRDAGQVTLGIFALTRVLVTIQGRHLRDLMSLLSTAPYVGSKRATPVTLIAKRANRMFRASRSSRSQRRELAVSPKLGLASSCRCHFRLKRDFT